jgi:AraC-like DNA-binding protein
VRAKAVRAKAVRANMAGVDTSDSKRFGTLPIAAGVMTRLAWARAKEAGIDPTPLLGKAGLTVQQIDDRGARLGAQNQIRFVALVAEAMQDDFLGFHLARDFDLRQIGLLYYVFRSSEVLGDALQRAVRYSTIVNECVSLRCLEGSDLAIGFSYVGVARRLDRHQIEFWLTSLVRACREATSRRLQPVRVKLTHRRTEDCTEFNAFMGRDAEFAADVDEVAFPAATRQVPLVGADRYLNELLSTYCEEALGQRQRRTGTLRLSVENALAPLLPHGKARLGEIAGRLGMSERTLARRLASEGLSFNAVLDEMKFDLAKRYLRDLDLSISEIAWLLGYQEVSAFTHAFKRWSGTTPREARFRTDLAGRATERMPRAVS